MLSGLASPSLCPDDGRECLTVARLVHWACQEMRMWLLPLKVSASPEPAVLSLFESWAATVLLLVSLFLINTLTSSSQHLL